MFRTIMSILCNESTLLSNKPECQLKGLNGSISFIPGPLIGYQHPGDLLINILSWSLFNERGAGELSAGNTRIHTRANRNNSRKGGRIQGGVEAEANLEGPLCPRRPCLSGFFLMASSWMGSWTALPAWYFLHDHVMGGISHNGSRQETTSPENAEGEGLRERSRLTHHPTLTARTWSSLTVRLAPARI